MCPMPDCRVHLRHGQTFMDFSASDREPGAALGATGTDDGAATTGTHALEETVGAGTAD